MPSYPISQPVDNAPAYTYTQPIRDAIAGVNDHQTRIETLEGSAVAGYTDEQVDDRVNNLIVAGSNITKSYNDAANTLTLSAAVGAHNHTGAEITSGTIATARLGSGTASADTYLHGDSSWGGLDASDLTVGTAPTARLGSGTASASTFLRGDQAWADPGLLPVPVHAVGNSGTALTLDASNASGWIKTITLNGNCTLTLTGATSGRATTLELILTQDATGSRTITWPAAVKWSGGAPTLSTAANAVDRIVLTTYNGGTTWYGDLIGKGYA